MTSRTPRAACLETTPATLTHDDVAINSYQGDFRDLSDLVRLVEGTLNPQVLASNPRPLPPTRFDSGLLLGLH